MIRNFILFITNFFPFVWYCCWRCWCCAPLCFLIRYSTEHHSSLLSLSLSVSFLERRRVRGANREELEMREGVISISRLKSDCVRMHETIFRKKSIDARFFSSLCWEMSQAKREKITVDAKQGDYSPKKKQNLDKKWEGRVNTKTTVSSFMHSI